MVSPTSMCKIAGLSPTQSLQLKEYGNDPSSYYAYIFHFCIDFLSPAKS